MLLPSYIFLQSVLFFLITFHDWIHVPPLTNINDIDQHTSKKGKIINTLVNAIAVLIPLALTVRLYVTKMSKGFLLIIALMYALLTLGTIVSWWLPYFFGIPKKLNEMNKRYFKNTHHFLPSIGNNATPNTFHVLMHSCIWSALGMALFLVDTFEEPRS